jgi:hypothetical protein
LENRVLRGIFGPKRDDVKGEWRKLHNGELNDPEELDGLEYRSGGGERSVQGFGGET